MPNNISITANPGRAKWRLSGIFLTGALAVEVYLLLNDVSFWNPAIPKKNEPIAPPVAELVRRQNTVRTQDQGELVWEDTQDGQTLRRRQTVLTLDRSKAEIAFLDGTGLVLDENSLIQLEKSPGDDSPGTQKIIVRLLRGTLHKRDPRKRPDLLRKFGEKAPEFEIQLGAARVELDPASELTVVATPESPAGNKILVQNGQVKVDTPQGGVEVRKGEEISLPPAAVTPPQASARARAVSAEAAPVLAAHRTPFNLLGPRSGESLQLDAPGEVKFRWNADRLTAAGQPMALEISADPAFKSKVTRVRIPATEPPLEYIEVKAKVPASGQAALWYWRVQTEGTRTPQVSDVEHFWAQPDAGPKLKFPADRVVARSGTPIEFSWAPAEDSGSYELDIREYKLIPLAEAVTQVDGLSPGAYHWRVRMKSRDGRISPWSETRTFTIRDAQAVSDVPPPPAELGDAEILPAGAPSTKDGAAPARQKPQQPAPAHTSLWDWLLAPAWAEESASAAVHAKDPAWSVRLHWKPVSGIEHYRIQVGRERSFTHVLTEAEVNQPEFRWTYKVGMENTKGRVFYRVASISAHGTLGPYSQPKPIPIPERIRKQVESRVATGRNAAETYSATENEGAGAVPTDAAAQGNLESLAASGKDSGPAKPVESFNLLGPDKPASEVPAAAKSEARLAERIAERAQAGPEVPKLADTLLRSPPGGWPAPEASPAPLVAPPLAPGQAPEASAPSIAPAPAAHSSAAALATTENRWRWMAALDAGVGNEHQTSGDGSLGSVSMQGVFVHQKLEAAAELTRITKPADPRAPEETDRWTALMQASFAAFHKPDGTPTTVQPDVKAFAFKLDVLRWDWGTTARAFEPWGLALGLTLDREYRWVKLSPQVLDPQGALGVGPAALAVREYSGRGVRFGLTETGVELSIPLSGMFVSGGYGLEGNVWGEWNLAAFRESWIGLRAEAEAAYLLWRAPAGTSTTSWTASLAAALHFDGPAR